MSFKFGCKVGGEVCVCSSSDMMFDKRIIFCILRRFLFTVLGSVVCKVIRFFNWMFVEEIIR